MPSISVERLERLLKAVDDGFIRVGDPFMYKGQAPVYPTDKGTALGQELVEMLN